MVKITKLISLFVKDGPKESEHMNPRCITSHKLCKLEIGVIGDD